jgi:hypothetical protein
LSSTPLTPDAAPNAPFIVIDRSGSSAIALDWGHPDASLTRYEVWRGDSPYFTPGAGGALIGSFAFSEGVFGENAPFSYVDNGVCAYFTAGQTLPCAPQDPPVKVIGDVDHQHYWVVRASNGELVDSNRVGEFDYALFRGG